MGLKNNTSKTKFDSMSRLENERKLSSIFEAQEKNKRKDCDHKNENLWKRFEENKNIESRNQLIRKYLYLVNWVVNRLPVSSLKSMDKDDLVGYGIIGLIEAVDRFDLARNCNFESFAITRIKGSIYDQLRASDLLTRGSRKKVKGLLKATSNLENKLSRYPNDKEIASELSISLDELRFLQQEAQLGVFSLDEPKDNYSEETNTVIDSVSSNSIQPLEELVEIELKDKLTKAINSLPEREKTVVGLYHYQKLTFKEIADIMDFSESRASQIHARAISLLKSKMLKD